MGQRRLASSFLIGRWSGASRPLQHTAGASHLGHGTEANTRDVRLFVEPAEIRALWPRLIRHLGRSRDMWAWLLGLPSPEWPPRSQIRAG